MSGFVPPGCISCADALNQVHQARHGISSVFSENQWSAVFLSSDVQRTVRLKYEVAKKMRQSVFELQRQLFVQERFACYVGDDGLEDIKPAVFGKESGAHALVNNGKVRASLVGLEFDIYIREQSYEPSIASGRHQASDEDTKPNKSGRPNTSRDAALVYWGKFPNGHAAEKLHWSQAEGLVNAQLKLMGLKTVKRTAMEKAVNEYGLVIEENRRQT